MTRFSRLLRNVWERVRGLYYEGPEPPDRLAEMVLAFAEANPRATLREWIGFAAGLAGESYRSGYVRGFEWAERDMDRRDPLVDPEVRAEVEGHAWDWYEGSPLPEPSGLDETVVEGESVDVNAELARYAEEMPLGEIEDPVRR